MKHRPAARALLVCALACVSLAVPTARAADPAPPVSPAPVPPAPAAPPGSTGPSGSVPASVLRHTLPNGLRVVVVPDRLAPVVTTQLVYLAGSNDAPPGFPGMAHALEHMMFRGSKGLDKDQLYELGALLGGVYNANTEETVTQYTYTVPATDLGLVLRAEALRMEGASITQADWEQERGAIEQEVSRDLSSPVYNVVSQMQAALFEGTPYEHDALGTRASFDHTDAAMLRAFYERWYAPNNAILVIAGDVEPGRAMAEAEAAFAAIPRRLVPEHPAVTLGETEAKSLSLPTNLPVGLVALAYRMPGLASPDYAAAAILADVLSSQRGALDDLTMSGRALQTQFEYGPKTGVGLGIAIGAFPAGADPAPLMADLRRVIADAAAGNIPPELVEAAKRQRIAQLAFANDSISGLARSWARALSVQGGSSPDDVARAYAAVTLDDVRRLARASLDPAHAITAVLTPQGSGKPVAESGFGGAETVGSPPDHPVTLPAWAASALAEVRRPDSGMPPDVSVLPNGLRLIVQPEHVSRTVSVFGSVRHEAAVQEPPGKEGVASLVDELLGYGTTKRDRLAFREAIDEIAATENAASSFSLRVLTPQFEAGMRLLAEDELEPSFPDAAFQTVRRQYAQSLAGQLRSPPHLFDRALHQATLPENDVALRQATPETMAGITRDDLLAYYAAAFRPDLTTIVIVGDVVPEEARRVVAETFGGWQAQGKPPNVDLPAVGASTAARERVPDASTLQDDVALTETVTLPVTSPDRYTMTLGNVILGNGFSSRLYRDLRLRTGYVYSVSSGLNFSRTRARYTVSFGADPANVDAARALVLRDIEAMQTISVSDAELTRAKAQVLRLLAMQRANVGAIAGQYLRQTELDLPLDSDERAAVAYQATTADQIRQAFATWLRPGDLAEIVRGPAP